MPKPRLLCSSTKEAYCGTHLQPLQLFCDDDQVLVCSECFQSPEHKQHVVYGIQEAAEYYRKKAESQVRVELVNEKRYELLNGDEEMHLQELSHVGRENMSKLKTSEVWVGKHVCSLQKTVRELEKKCGESAIALLQNAKCYLERSEFLLLQSLKPAQLTDLSSHLIITMKKALKRFQRCFAYMYVSVSCVYIALVSQKRVLDLELELQIVVRHCVGPGNMNLGPLEEQPRCIGVLPAWISVKGCQGPLELELQTCGCWELNPDPLEEQFRPPDYITRNFQNPLENELNYSRSIRGTQLLLQYHVCRHATVSHHNDNGLNLCKCKPP
ncbi:hypothetical protein STEG23_001370 [Scotinomys teguina]